MCFSKSFLIATVAVGALTLSACGKKKEDPKEVAAPVQPTTSVEQPAQQPQGPIKPPPPPLGGTQRHVGDRPAGVRNGNKKGPVQDASDIETGKPVTGAQNKNGLLFTSSSPDNTLAWLRRGEAGVSAHEQEANKQLAQSIVGVELSQSLSTKDVGATIKVQEGSSVVAYNVLGVLIDNDLSQLNVVDSYQGIKSSGSGHVRGTMQCLDLDVGKKTCSNILLSVDLFKGHAKSNVKILVRNSVADLHFEMVDSSGNPEFEILKDFLMSSALDRDTKTKIDSITMQTFEVMNGASGYELQILGLNKEFLAFVGELVSPRVGISMNVAAKKTSSRFGYDPSNQKLRTNLANTIGTVRLVMNDGLGKVKLQLSSRAYSNYPVDTFTLTFTRRVSSVIDLDELSINGLN